MISKVDFTPSIGIKQRISVSQYDVGRRIVINLLDGYAPYVPPTSATAVMHATKPSGLGFSVSGTLDGAVASFETTAEMTAESGTMDAEVQISANGVVIGMANFVFYVEKSPHPTGIVDGTAEDVVNRIGAALDAAMDDIEDAKDAVVAEIQALVIATASQVSYDNTDSGLAATNVQDAVDEIKEDLSHKTGLSEDAKQALLACFAKVAWVDEHGQDYYDALEDALYPPADLVRITAVYTQSGTVYDTDTLDSLKAGLVVTAHYSDGTSGIVTTYALSGTLAEGTSTITVSYGGKTTTFTVIVTAGQRVLPPEYQQVEWVGATVTSATDMKSYIDVGISVAEKIGMSGYDITFSGLSKGAINKPAGATAQLLAWSSGAACWFGAIRLSQNGSSVYGFSRNEQEYFDASNVPVETKQDFHVYWNDTSCVAECGQYSCARDYAQGSADLSLKFGTGMWDNSGGSFKFYNDIKVKKDGTLVRDLFPCYRKTDSVIGFYDTVNNVFYTNQGSGAAFEKGADV